MRTVFTITLLSSMLWHVPHILAYQENATLANTERPNKLGVIYINIDGSNDASPNSELGETLGSPVQASHVDETGQSTSYIANEAFPDADITSDHSTHGESLSTVLLNTEVVETELPGKEMGFHLKIHRSTRHLVEGRSTADIGKILYKSRLMPSNEVKLSVKLKQREIDDIELIAYFDLANFVMELDGSNRVLNKEHKTLLQYTSTHLRHRLELEYRDYDFPDHALMLTQMLAYWSVSPEGYAHEKRSIVSQ